MAYTEIIIFYNVRKDYFCSGSNMLRITDIVFSLRTFEFLFFFLLYDKMGNKSSEIDSHNRPIYDLYISKSVISIVRHFWNLRVRTVVNIERGGTLQALALQPGRFKSLFYASTTEKIIKTFQRHFTIIFSPYPVSRRHYRRHLPTCVPYI